MTPVLQPFLSEMPVVPKRQDPPLGAFTIARVGRDTSPPWSPPPCPAVINAADRLPKGVVTGPRPRMDMSRHATVVLG